MSVVEFTSTRIHARDSFCSGGFVSSFEITSWRKTCTTHNTKHNPKKTKHKKNHNQKKKQPTKHKPNTKKQKTWEEQFRRRSIETSFQMPFEMAWHDISQCPRMSSNLPWKRGRNDASLSLYMFCFVSVSVVWHLCYTLKAVIFDCKLHNIEALLIQQAVRAKHEWTPAPTPTRTLTPRQFQFNSSVGPDEQKGLQMLINQQTHRHRQAAHTHHPLTPHKHLHIQTRTRTNEMIACFWPLRALRIKKKLCHAMYN